MTEPYPSTEVESKLKHLFRSLTRAHRAYKDTRNHALTLLHRASAAVLTAVLVYKALTYLLFLPAMNGIWSLTLRCSPVNYLTNNNAHQIFTSPTILGGIVLIVLLAACWNLYGFSILLHGFALARRGETLRPVSLFARSLGDIRHVLLPKNWPILLYCALLIPFTDVFVTYNYISQLAVPEYILGVIRANARYHALYLAGALVLLALWVGGVLVLPLFAVFTRVVQKRMLAAQLDNRRAVAAVSGQVPETLHNIRTIRALGLESYMERRYDRCIGDSYAAMERTNFYDAIYSPVVLALNAAVVGIVMLLSASGNATVLTFFGMSVGTSVAVINYISRIFAPIESLGMEIQTIQSAMAGVRRIDAFLDQSERTIPPARREAEGRRPG